MTWIHRLQAAVVALFVVAVALNLLVQRRRGIRAFVLAPEPGRRRLEVIALGGLAVWLALIALEGTRLVGSRLGPVWLDARWADGLGTALMLAGLAVGLLAYVQMGRAWRIGIDESSNESLVTRGVFAWSRNPIYLFLDLLALGVLLASGTAFFVLTGPAVWLGIHLRIREEERFLARRHGAEFEAYRAATARYFGRR